MGADGRRFAGRLSQEREGGAHGSSLGEFVPYLDLEAECFCERGYALDAARVGARQNSADRVAAEELDHLACLTAATLVERP